MIYQPCGFCREIRGWNPSVDLFETTDTFILEADLPGVKAENVKVEMKDGELVLREEPQQRQIPYHGAMLR
jgi:HSP20 family protein